MWRQIENSTGSIDTYLLEDIPEKFHPNPIWNDVAVVFSKELPQQEQQQDE